ncbi:MAG: Trk system potassium transporter TrkA [Clostridia bacterium]|nr:Trk system potassium transporter TrkA [Clostridia bacterium]
MKIIIIGAGGVGEALLQNFIRENHNVTVIDSNRKIVEHLVNLYDVQGIAGGGLEREVLTEARVGEADIIIACTNRDELNILACVLAKKLGAQHTIARVRDPEYFKEIENLRNDLGLDMVFNPERRTAIEIQEILNFPSAKNVESFADGKAIMAEFEVKKVNQFGGKSVVDIAREYGCKVLFGLIVRGKKTIIPHGDTIIENGDTVYLVGAEKEIAAFCKKTKLFKAKAKSVFIVGGGKVAYYLAEHLLKEGADVKILESNEERCHQLAQLLPRATVIHGDGTDQSVLDEESITNCDACVTLTGFDEGNVMISLYAMQKEVKKVITKIDRASIITMANGLGLDSLVSPRVAIANHIIKFVRTHKTDEASGINTYFRLNDKAEALEFLVGGKFKYLNKSLKELSMRRDGLICGIVRGEEYILPSGDTHILEGDKVIVVTGVKQITELNQIFK